jgi:hypothetical protein
LNPGEQSLFSIAESLNNVMESEVDFLNDVKRNVKEPSISFNWIHVWETYKGSIVEQQLTLKQHVDNFPYEHEYPNKCEYVKVFIKLIINQIDDISGKHLTLDKLLELIEENLSFSYYTFTRFLGEGNVRHKIIYQSLLSHSQRISISDAVIHKNKLAIN